MTNLDVIHKKKKIVNLCLSKWTKWAYKTVIPDITRSKAKIIKIMY